MDIQYLSSKFHSVGTLFIIIGVLLLISGTIIQSCRLLVIKNKYQLAITINLQFSIYI